MKNSEFANKVSFYNFLLALFLCFFEVINESILIAMFLFCLLMLHCASISMIDELEEKYEKKIKKLENEIENIKAHE